jgi:hypothetical protein
MNQHIENIYLKIKHELKNFSITRQDNHILIHWFPGSKSGYAIVFPRHINYNLYISKSCLVNKYKTLLGFFDYNEPCFKSISEIIHHFYYIFFHKFCIKNIKPLIFKKQLQLKLLSINHSLISKSFLQLSSHQLLQYKNTIFYSF